MSKRNEIIAGLLGIWFLCGIAAYATEVDTMGNLTDTSAKISSIDMDKNPDDTGKILDVFYTGAKTKEETSSPVVFAGTGNRETSQQEEKEVCNAKPSKISLAGKVPPLTLLPDVKYTWHGPNPNPSNDPIIENGMNQHYQNWCDNHPGSNACNPSNPHSPSYNPDPNYNANPAVHSSANPATCVGGNCGLP